MINPVKVSVVHDVTGRIVSVSRLAQPSRVIVLGGVGQLVLETEVEEESIKKIMYNHRVNTSEKTIVSR